MRCHSGHNPFALLGYISGSTGCSSPHLQALQHIAAVSDWQTLVLTDCSAPAAQAEAACLLHCSKAHDVELLSAL